MSDNHKNDLFDLIKSMNMSEKRYFKIFASRHTIGEKNNYVRLFDAIEKQKEYNERQLRISESYLSQYSVIKKNLYDLILKSLDAFNYNSSKEREVMNAIHYIEILYHKGLYKQCQKLLNKAKEDVKKLTSLDLEAIINKWQLNLFIAIDYKDIVKEDLVYLKDKIETLQIKIKNEEDLSLLNLALHYKIRTTGVVRDPKLMQEIESLFKKVSQYTSHFNQSFLSAFYFFNIHYIYFYSTTNFEECYKYIHKCLDLFEREPWRKTENNSIYLNLLSNKLGIENNRFMFDESKKTLELLKNTPVISAVNKELVSFRIIINELAIYCLSVDFEGGYKKVKHYDDFFSSVEFEKVNISTWYILHFQAAFLCIGSNHFNTAIRFLNRIINKSSNYDSRADIVCVAKILLVLAHYENGNERDIENSVKSVYRFLLRKEKLFEFEKVLLNFLKKIPTLKNGIITNENFSDLKLKLEEVVKDPFEKGVMEYFDFISWFESKLSNRPFGEIILEKFKAGYYN